MRFAVDTGGTFTDLVVEDDLGDVRLYKSATTPENPVKGVLDTLTLAAEDYNKSRKEFLGGGDLLIHGTTRAINAIVTENTAKTAFFTTMGHPDILVFREGGRIEPFDFSVTFPKPYVPRHLTYEVSERIRYDGKVIENLDESKLIEQIKELKEEKVEAVGVCLLWSIVNPIHENRIGELLLEHLPGIPFTLSHLINPSLREYRRASSTVIDASLKPLMEDYLGGLSTHLHEAGFLGRVLVVTTQGGAMDAEDMAGSPIHSINSGPAMAPVAGRHYSNTDSGIDTAIIADTGGTTFDVSLVRGGRIPWTRETWIGQQYRGHMTGFPAVDVKSIGAGGGSIAWVDEGGLLHVGPQSAGAVPGPVSYGKGGKEPTVTDAAVVLGWIDPDYFLGGAMTLDKVAAEDAIQNYVGDKLGLDLHESAFAILTVATENMVHAIEDITVNQGIDPRGAVLIGGGGAAGLNMVAIGARLGCKQVIIPDTAATLSAAGALMSDLRAEFSATLYCHTDDFSFNSVNEILSDLESRCIKFLDGPGADSLEHTIEYTAEARYPHQIWEIEVPLHQGKIETQADVEKLRKDFHRTHKEVFAISDETSEVEIVGWRANVSCKLRENTNLKVMETISGNKVEDNRKAFFGSVGLVDSNVYRFEDMKDNVRVVGPSIIESSFTTIVVDPGSEAFRNTRGSLICEQSS
ncbi:MAG: 5-oxoprolinase [Rhodospirillaceae bacterium]|nr:5-oxoprolinase [Rhodospirillaceae bacterium]|tara:strand:+ start:731 stop:2800 length:2070 start_codon:yes stop_codon:yes gene_type:complete